MNEPSTPSTPNYMDALSCAPGEYQYAPADRNNIRRAYGQLRLAPMEERARSPAAQSAAGGERRRADDDGGHLIGAMFGGSPAGENLFPQNSRLNRHQGYRAQEREWADLLNGGNQVFVDVYTSASNDDNREDAIYGTYTVVDCNGNQYTEAFSFANESAATQDSWQNTLESLDNPGGGNSMATAAVTREAISKAVGLCQQSIESLNKASQGLQQKYQAAGQGWKDSKYAQLGGIVTECRSALGKPVDQLQSCIASLQDLASAVSEYEDVSF